MEARGLTPGLYWAKLKLKSWEDFDPWVLVKISVYYNSMRSIDVMGSDEGASSTEFSEYVRAELKTPDGNPYNE